jgi:hypothetical protein
MCNDEAESMLISGRLSWHSKFKWFGTKEFLKDRVLDGKFNNSKFKPDRYSRIFEFEIEEASIKHFNKCGYRELMLSVRKVPLVKIKIIREVSFSEIVQTVQA